MVSGAKFRASPPPEANDSPHKSTDDDRCNDDRCDVDYFQKVLGFCDHFACTGFEEIELISYNEDDPVKRAKRHNEFLAWIREHPEV